MPFLFSRQSLFWEELMNRETREKVDSSKGYLGVSLANLTTEAIEMYNMPTGAFVRSVEDDSPAQEAGICKGDIIVKFDGQKVSDGDDLLDKLQYYKSGEKIEAVIARATNGEYEENTIRRLSAPDRTMNKTKDIAHAAVSFIYYQ